jgi:hypothetical protein
MFYTGLNISKGSGKMKNIPSINTNTLTNDWCIEQHSRITKNLICSECYSFNMLETFRKNCIPSFQHNSEYLSSHIMSQYEMPVLNSAFFRYSSHGELINDNHFINLINIAKFNKNTTFALWTKRATIIKNVLKTHKKPKNLILVFSNPKIDKPIKSIPANFDKVFNNISKDSTVKPNCFGRCIDCKKCYTHSKSLNKNIVIETVK